MRREWREKLVMAAVLMRRQKPDMARLLGDIYTYKLAMVATAMLR